MTIRNRKSVSIIDILRWRAVEQREREVFRFWRSELREDSSLTFGVLDQQAEALACLLSETTEVGDRAMLLFEPGPEFIVAFFGALYAGLIAVPAYPPGLARLSRSLPRLLGIIDNAGISIVLSTQKLIEAVRPKLFQGEPRLKQIQWLATDSGVATSPFRVPTYTWSPTSMETIAFLQYTSGSTGSPKGVAITYGNLDANERQIQRSFEIDQGTQIFSWLPPYHDMGLVGSILQPIYSGANATMMSPAAFLRRPARWLNLISKTRSSVSGAPNFAYQLSARAASESEVEGLDLSCWSVAFCGAEPIRAGTLDEFVRRFAICGFRREAFFPCYGLAESTLFVTGAGKLRGPTITNWDRNELQHGRAVQSNDKSRIQHLVSSGTSVPDQEIIIVDPESEERLPERRIGEIWVRSASVARGYWCSPEVTVDVFGATTLDRDGPFLRTGDMGFLSESDLYVTGRAKEMIIARGRNIYPQDIEAIVDTCNPAGRVGCSVAFGLDRKADGEVELIVAQEIDLTKSRNIDLVSRARDIHRAILADFGIGASEVLFLPPRSIAKTTSGKLGRVATRELFVGHQMKPILRWSSKNTSSDSDSLPIIVAPRNSLETAIAAMWTQLQGMPVPCVEVSLFDLGADSLVATRFLGEIEARFGVEVSMADIVEEFTIGNIAKLVGLGIADRSSAVDVNRLPGGVA